MWTRVMRTRVGEKNVAESMQAIGETDPWTMLAILGLTVLTVVTRSFFLWSEEKMPIPAMVSAWLALRACRGDGRGDRARNRDAKWRAHQHLAGRAFIRCGRRLAVVLYPRWGTGNHCVWDVCLPTPAPVDGLVSGKPSPRPNPA